MIAMALSCDPQLLIADEPTTALDVTTQDQILQLLNELKAEFGMAILLITHDLAVIAQMAQRVAVMYAGEIVEYTDVRTLFDNPRHPYAWGLVGFVPRADQTRQRLVSIPGTVPNPRSFPRGCRFHPRCPLADQQCKDTHPLLERIGENHLARCWHHDRVEQLAGPDGFNSSGETS
jgi:oligopeptide/dipeptide ABC transporter ATP-binding protein